MSERITGLGSHALRFAKEAIPAMAKTLPVGAAIGLFAVGGQEAVYHRGRTHHVLKTPKLVDEAFRLDQRSMGVPFVGEWEMTHRVHHREPDMSLKPALDIWRAWEAFRTTNPHTDFELPKTVPHIDPYIGQFPIGELLRVGALAEEFVAERLGVDYEEKKTCSQAELEALVRPTKPTYYYQPRVKLPDDYEYTQDEKATALISDPHSMSLLHPQEAFWREHLGLYKDRSDIFVAEPSLKDPDLHRDNEYRRKSSVPYVVGGVALPALAAFAARRKMSVSDLLVAGLVGGSIYGERAYVEVGAGKFVNFFGHLGAVDERKLNDILHNRPFYVLPNPSGTVSSNLVDAGMKGKIIGFLTGGDAGVQDEHHIKPWKNLFSSKAGIKAFGEDPIGFSLEEAKKHISSFKEGDQFNLPQGDRRPDAASEAAEIVHEHRRRDLEAGTTPITPRRLYPHKGEFADAA